MLADTTYSAEWFKKAIQQLDAETNLTDRPKISEILNEKEIMNKYDELEKAKKLWKQSKITDDQLLERYQKIRPLHDAFILWEKFIKNNKLV